MRYSVAAIVAFAATAFAGSNETVWVTTVVDTYTTVCPASATITIGGSTYTNTLTESSTITITDCPCTISAPVYTTSSVYCVTCVIPTVAPVYPNATTPVVVPTSAPVGTVGTTAAPAPTSSSTVPASGANKAFAMSGASLAGLLGLAAYLL